MPAPLSLRIGVPLLAALSLFWLPWPLTVVLMFGAGYLYPPLALLIGIAADILYYPGHGYPHGAITGAVVTALAVMLRTFVKTRIM
jgi:hypothetical protein